MTAHVKTGIAPSRPKDLKTWSNEALAEISNARKMIEDCLAQLDFSVRRAAPKGSSQYDKDLCQDTRMVIIAGETLCNLTRIYTRWSEKPAPQTAWDPSLAARTDALVEAGANLASTEPHKTNCTERLKYLREAWPRWCPEFKRAT